MPAKGTNKVILFIFFNGVINKLNVQNSLDLIHFYSGTNALNFYNFNFPDRKAFQFSAVGNKS